MTPAEKRERVLRAMRATGWNVSEAARRLGVLRQALQRDLRRWGGVARLRNAPEAPAPPTPEARCSATHLKLVAGATHRKARNLVGATQNAENGDVALTLPNDEPNFVPVSSSAQPIDVALRQATVLLSFDEWIWLRRRAEREAAAGGDSSVRGAIKACIVEAMAKDEGPAAESAPTTPSKPKREKKS